MDVQVDAKPHRYNHFIPRQDKPRRRSWPAIMRSHLGRALANTGAVCGVFRNDDILQYPA